MTFENLGLSESVLRGVRAAGYTVPTEIQALAIPPALGGGDVIGRAKTGSGKTAAFILPTIDRLLTGGHRRPNGVRALVLTPTRELAQQVADATFTYARHLKLRGEAMYGGVNIEPQLKKLRHGLDILAATPGRLLDHIERGSVDLSHCEVLIVDEADRMFDMGFIKDVKRIIAQLSPQRQTMLFSATMSKEVRTLTASIMHEPAYVQVGVEGNPAESVRQHFYAVQKQEKYDFLHHLLTKEQMDSVLVFSRTKYGANKIARRLSRSGIDAGVLHSDRSQNQRQEALDSFKKGRVRVLIATDIAARGIDVRGISHVINFDTPNFAEDYVHRIGRTGRAEASGDAITFVSADEKDNLKRIERFVGRRYDVMSMPGGVERTENPDLRGKSNARPALAAQEQPAAGREHRRSDDGKQSHSRRDRTRHDRGRGEQSHDRREFNEKGRSGKPQDRREFAEKGHNGKPQDRREFGEKGRKDYAARDRREFGANGPGEQPRKHGKKRPAGNGTKSASFKPNGFKKKGFKSRTDADGRRRDPRFA